MSVHRIGKNVPGTGNVMAMLEEVRSKVARDEVPKVMVLVLDDTKPGQYVNGYFNAGMSVADMLALLEVTKSDLLEYMRGRNG